MLLGVYFAKHEGKISLMLANPNLDSLKYRVSRFATPYLN